MRRSGLGVGDVVGGRFRLTGEIGAGGMGRVFEAIDLLHDRPAAVKVVGRQLASDPEFRTRFGREASAAERANHPHVLPIWDHGAQGGSLYLATPLCDTDLAELVYEQRGRLDPDEALGILSQVAWALDWAHGRGVVHRDVKPENILLVAGPGEAHAYLADFGLAKAVTDHTVTQLGYPAGLSPAYAAPEQWEGGPVGPNADQYALAATLFACLAGQPPFYPRRGEQLREAHLSLPPPPLGGGPDSRVDRLSGVVARGLAKDPDDRFRSCGELIDAAKAALRSGWTTEREAPPDGRRAQTGPAHPAAAGRSRAEDTIEDQAAPVASLLAPPVTETDATRQPPTALDTDAGRPPASRADRPALARRLAPLRRLPDRLDRRSTILVVAAASALAVAVVVLRLGGGGGAAAPAVTRLAVGGRPAALAAAGGSIWVANQRDATLTRIDPTRAKVTVRAKRTVSLPARLAAGDTGLWVASTTGAVSRLNPQTGEPIAAERTLRTEIYDVVAAAGALWVANGTAGTVERYAVAGARLSAPVEVHVGKGTSALAAGADSVWAVSPDSGTLTRLDPASGQPRAQLGVGLGADDVAVSGRAVWVSNPDRGTLTRVDANTGKVTRTVRVPRATDGALAAGRGAVYFLNSDTGAVTRVDATSGRIRGDPLVAASPGATDALAAKGALWITDSNRDAVERVTY